jgi:pimeloyl-ACP methyl ester carboxylesterase
MPTVREHDYLAALLADLVYRDDVDPGDELFGGRILAVGTAGIDGEWLLWGDDTRLMLVIRGSEAPTGSPVDWLVNLFALPLCGVHGGYLVRATEVLGQVGPRFDDWRVGRVLTVVGHSLGAGTTLACAALIPPAWEARYVTFAAPRSLTRRTVRSLSRLGVNARVVNYIGDRDPIRYLLAAIYTRLGKVIRLPGVTHSMRDYVRALKPEA